MAINFTSSEEFYYIPTKLSIHKLWVKWKSLVLVLF